MNVWENLPPEAEFSILEGFSIGQDTLLRYAWASGDYNEIHYNVQVAQSKGLPGVIVHGMYSMALLKKMLLAHLKKTLPNAETLRFDPVSFDTKFVAMVPVGEAISINARIHHASETEASFYLYMFKSGSRDTVLCSGNIVLKALLRD